LWNKLRIIINSTCVLISTIYPCTFWPSGVKRVKIQEGRSGEGSSPRWMQCSRLIVVLVIYGPLRQAAIAHVFFTLTIFQISQISHTFRPPKTPPTASFMCVRVLLVLWFELLSLLIVSPSTNVNNYTFQRPTAANNSPRLNV